MTMDTHSTTISLATLPTALQDQIFQEVYLEGPSRSITPQIQAPLTSNRKTGINLLLLPTEIRHQIYRHVFHTRYIIPSFTDLTFPDPTPLYAGNRISNTSLLQTCKALHEDALEFMYATVTFRVLFPDETKETLVGPSQAIINRMEHVEIDIDMTHYHAPNTVRTVRGTTTISRPIDIFYSTMLLKLSARETAGIACRIIFRHCWSTRMPWGTLPFLEALKRVPKYRTVTLEVRALSLSSMPHIEFLSGREVDGLFQNLKDELERCLRTSLGQANGRYRSLELHPREKVAKKTVPDVALVTENPDEDEAGEEGAGEENSNEEDQGDEDTSGEDSGEADFDEEDSAGEDCFQDWRWRDL